MFGDCDTSIASSTNPNHHAQMNSLAASAKLQYNTVQFSTVANKHVTLLYGLYDPMYDMIVSDKLLVGGAPELLCHTSIFIPPQYEAIHSMRYIRPSCLSCICFSNQSTPSSMVPRHGVI